MGTVLVVGGAGYLGSVLSEELLDRGFAVRILDRLHFGDAGIRPFRDRVDLIVADMRRADPAWLRGVDSVINVGGLSNDPTAEYNPRANHEMNTVAAGALADLCLKAGVRRYLYASSCSVYDRGVVDEALDHLLDETAEVHPSAAYSRSKYDAERLLLEKAGKDFCPVILRMGTLYGFSGRMRYDLVVNTFVKDALSKGVLTLNYGGEMWRPLLHVRDAAKAYVAALGAPEDKVRGETFNIVFQNIRISEVALRVREALLQAGVTAQIVPNYRYASVRNYRVSGKKIHRVLGVSPQISIEDAAKDMVESIRKWGYTDFEDPRYYNIRWMRLLEEASRVMQGAASVFDLPPAGTP